MFDREVWAGIAHFLLWFGCGEGDRGIVIRYPAGTRNFVFPKRPDRPWDPHPTTTLLFSGYRVLFSRKVKRLGRKADHSSSRMPRWRMRRAVPPLPSPSLWRSPCLSPATTFCEIWVSHGFFEYADYGLCKDVMACSLEDGVPASGIAADFIFMVI